ncbi:MAG: hypothetical protein EP332_06735 [Bacteroidetes bacterium]|nr:MAG: hypothetical protein EP332_06735 [Bacteroidota bacterium]
MNLFSRIVFSLLITLPLGAFAQLVTDDDRGQEIREVLLNYRNHGVSKVKIRGGSYDRLRYEWLNDTLLQLGKPSQQTKFVFKNNDFTYIWNHQDSLRSQMHDSGEFVVTLDSGNHFYIRTYSIEGSDTVLKMEHDQFSEGNRNIYIVKYEQNGEWIGSKNIWIKDSDSSVSSEYYSSINGNWTLKFQFQEISTQDSIPFEKTVTSKSYFTTNYDGVDPKAGLLKRTEGTRITRFYYNKLGLIYKLDVSIQYNREMTPLTYTLRVKRF